LEPAGVPEVTPAEEAIAPEVSDEDLLR